MSHISSQYLLCHLIKHNKIRSKIHYSSFFVFKKMFKLPVRKIDNYEGLGKEVILRFFFDDRNMALNNETLDLVIKILKFNNYSENILIKDGLFFALFHRKFNLFVIFIKKPFKNYSKIYNFQKLAEFAISDSEGDSSFKVFIDSPNGEEPNFKIETIADNFWTWLIADKFKLTAVTYDLGCLIEFAKKNSVSTKIERNPEESYLQISHNNVILHGIRGCTICNDIIETRKFSKHMKSHINQDINIRSFCLFNITDTLEAKLYLKDKFLMILKQKKPNARLLLKGKRDLLNTVYSRLT